MRTPSARSTLLLFVTLSIPSLAIAHEREFTQSRDWFLPYKGEHELEWRSFLDTTHGSYRAQFEYEYGITDWFAIEPGLELAEKPDDEGSYEIEGADVELRFHYGDFAFNKILPAFNIEYEHPFEDDDGEEPAIELKGILSFYTESGNDFALNMNVGKQLSGEKESESEATFGWVTPLHEEAMPSAGWHNGVRAGLEVVQDFEEHNTRVGPLVVYRPSKNLNTLFHYGVGVNDRDGDNFDQAAMILEYEF